jgi:hypothetical protein
VPLYKQHLGFGRLHHSARLSLTHLSLYAARAGERPTSLSLSHTHLSLSDLSLGMEVAAGERGNNGGNVRGRSGNGGPSSPLSAASHLGSSARWCGTIPHHMRPGRARVGRGHANPCNSSSCSFPSSGFGATTSTPQDGNG